MVVPQKRKEDAAGLALKVSDEGRVALLEREVRLDHERREQEENGMAREDLRTQIAPQNPQAD